MALAADDARILQAAEAVADGVWKLVMGWQPFAREAMGTPLVRAADSIGASIAGAFGREDSDARLASLYQARAALYETKYWLNRAVARDLIDDMALRGNTAQLADLARQLNAFLGLVKPQRSGAPVSARAVREPVSNYWRWPDALFDDEELGWLEGNL